MHPLSVVHHLDGQRSLVSLQAPPNVPPQVPPKAPPVGLSKLLDRLMVPLAFPPPEVLLWRPFG